MDSFEMLGSDALAFLVDIEREASIFDPDPPNPLRISKASFLSSLSHSWQLDNALIVKQWLRESRSTSL
jgi:hypothetical protein